MLRYTAREEKCGSLSTRARFTWQGELVHVFQSIFMWGFEVNGVGSTGKRKARPLQPAKLAIAGFRFVLLRSSWLHVWIYTTLDPTPRPPSPLPRLPSTVRPPPIAVWHSRERQRKGGAGVWGVAGDGTDGVCYRGTGGGAGRREGGGEGHAGAEVGGSRRRSGETSLSARKMRSEKGA